MKRRVVVTGLGAITPIGNDVESFWSGIKAGHVGISEITRFDTTDYKVKIAAEVKDFSGKDILGFRTAKRMELFSQYAVVAAMEAVKDAGLDMLVSNFMYDKQGARHKKIMRYRSAMTPGKMLGWEDIHFGRTQYLLMHSVIYRTKILRECGMELPKHTFYVDNIYVFQPLPYVKNIYYLDVCLYKYFIGRDDQSVHESVMIKRLDQQYRVTKLMLEIYNSSPKDQKNANDAMIHYFDMMMCVSSILSIREGSEERLKDKEKLWKQLEEANPELYGIVRNSLLGRTMNLPGKFGRKCSVVGYKVVNKFFGFN